MHNKILITSLILITFFAYLTADWYLQHNGANRLYGIDFPPGQTNYGYACGANSYALRTTNGGATWTPCTTQVAGDYMDLDFPVDYLTGYLAGDFGLVAKTTDGGSIWQLGNITVSEQNFCIQFPGQDQLGFVGSANGFSAVTYDGGMSYTLMNISPPYDLYDVHFINPEFGMGVGENGTILLSYGTPEWFPVTSPTTEPLHGVYILEDGMTIWVVGSNATCYKSNDGGQNWERVVLPIQNTIQLNAVIFPSLTDGYICGSSGIILNTNDGGDAWDTTTVAGGEDLYDIVFPSGADDGWVCGSGEVIYSTHEIGIEENISKPNPLITLSSTPNPFRSHTVINFSHPINPSPFLKIYDCSGKLVRTLTLKSNGTTIWDGRNDGQQKVQPGVYMLETTTNDGFAQRLKLVLLN